MSSNNEKDYREILRQRAREVKYVTSKIKDLKANDSALAKRDNIFDMSIEEFLKWFDANAITLFKSVAYSRIKNNSNYQFEDYIRDRKQLRKALPESKSKVKLVRRNSRLRTSFTVVEGPLLVFGSTMMFDHAFTVQSMPHAVDKDLKYCVQFSSRFKNIADQFCEDIKSEVVYRTLQNVRSTAIYHKRSDKILTY